MIKCVKASLLVGLLLTFNVTISKASLIDNSFGLSGSHSTITFDEHVFASGTSLTNQYEDMGVIFSPFAYYGPYGASDVSNFMPHGYAYQFSLILTTPQTEIAFQLATGGPATLYAYLGGNLVESDSIAAASGTDFYGFSNITFDQIYIQSSYNGIGNASGTGPLILDNLQLAAPVPIPSAIWLFGSALAGLVGFNRRKAKYVRTAYSFSVCFIGNLESGMRCIPYAAM